MQMRSAVYGQSLKVASCCQAMLFHAVAGDEPTNNSNETPIPPPLSPIPCCFSSIPSQEIPFACGATLISPLEMRKKPQGMTKQPHGNRKKPHR